MDVDGGVSMGLSGEEGSFDPFLGRNVVWLLRQQVEEHPDRECLVWNDLDGSVQRWSYRQLSDLVEAVAGGLLDRGFGSGDHLCIHMENSPDFVFSWLAALSFGAVAVILPFSTTGQAIEMANDTPFGLAANVWSEDPDQARYVAEQLRAGTVWINGGGSMRPDAPFGGYGRSGVGRELGSGECTNTLRRSTSNGGSESLGSSNGRF